MDVEKIIALIGVTAGAFKAITSGLKDIHDMRKTNKKKKRRSPAKKKRRK
ncbi:hypothetical protein [Oceanobacillus oncorhynchi]|nr:hypothetical protein [Oceanobacillus oncorhynchi]MDM8100921.1 hypothetical protein [Oceanobacillus oncorhynchi]